MKYKLMEKIEPRPVTTKQIAELAGVSRPVVSAVLNGNDGPNIRVSQEKREKIMELARNLRYRPNPAAMQLKGCSRKSIGIIMDCYIFESRADLIKQLSIQLRLQGYQSHFAAVTDPVHELETIQDFITRGVSGIIQAYTANRIEHEKYPIPIVGLEDVEGADISSDFGYGIRVMTRHLIDHGHTKVGYICMKKLFNNRKFQGCQEALREAGITPEDDWMVELTWNESLPDNLLHLIEKEQVRAFACGSDRIAAKFISWLARHGYRVPEDVAVTGYDGSELSNLTGVPLTTAVIRNNELARKGIDLLLHKIEEHQLTKLVPPLQVKPMFRLSRSCGCPIHRDNGIYWEWVPLMLGDMERHIKEPPTDLKPEIDLLAGEAVLKTIISPLQKEDLS